MTARPIRRALFSVSDKTGLVEFGRFLHERGVEILSTGGTAKALRDAGLPVTDVSDYTGFPEMLDGRVKTLHPLVHGGLLGIRGNAEHEAAMSQHGIKPIDLLVVNLYPFESTVAKGADFETCIENIDIGGPALIRGAAKNHNDVTVVVDVEDYQAVMESMSANGGATTLELRRRLAATAYARTGAYDAAISAWFASQIGETFPRRIVVAGELKQSLRYGENPHQKAAFYITGDKRPGVATARQLQGKELSYNNLNDTDAAFELAAEFDRPAVAIIKHANPCGVAVGDDILSAYKAALACDPVSAFGGIVAVNRKLDGATAEEIAANSGAYESESGNPYVDLTVAKVIHERAKAEMAKLELKKRIGELMLASEVSRDVATAFAAIAQDLRAIPDRLERQMGLAPEVAEAMAEQIDAALAALGARLRNLNAEESHARKRA